VNDVEPSWNLLLVHDDTRSTHVTTTGNHDDVSGLKLDVVDNFVLDKVKLDSVVDFDSWVRVSDGSAVVGDDVWDTLGTELVTTDLAELEVGLLRGDSVDGESTLDVVEESEVLAGSLNGDDVWMSVAAQEPLSPLLLTHESSGESLVGSDLSVDLDETLLNDGGDFTAGKSVLQSVTKEDGEGEGLSELVGTGRWAGGLIVRNFQFNRPLLQLT